MLLVVVLGGGQDDFGGFDAATGRLDWPQVELVEEVLGSSRGAISAFNAIGTTFFDNP